MAFFTGNKQADDKEKAGKNILLFSVDPKNVLITGSKGQLGSEIKRVAEKHDDMLKFFFTDVDTLDITNLEKTEKYINENGIKYIINCAAYTAVDKAEDDVDLCYRVNRDAPANLGKVANKFGVRVIHVSTDYVFDGNGTRPYLETDEEHPQSVYGKSKLEGEIALQEACHESIIIRTAWLYSVYGNNFVKTMMRLGTERDSLNVVADQSGTPTNAADLAKAIVRIIDYSEANSNFHKGIYHFTNEGTTTWYDFTVAIHKEANISCEVNPITTDQYPTKAIRPRYSVLDKNKIKDTFELEIPAWEDSLKMCIKELLSK